jgi:hypothetical protein
MKMSPDSGGGGGWGSGGVESLGNKMLQRKQGRGLGCSKRSTI